MSIKRIVANIAVVVIAWVGAVASWIAVGPDEPADARADAALVLGAAVMGETPSPVFAARIDHAVQLYREGRVQKIVFTGGRSSEDGLSEAEAASRYAQAAGVPAGAIVLEDRSRTTRRNLANAAPILRREGIGSVLLVSDPLHLRRALAMARAEGIEAGASATPTSRYRSLSTRLPFLAREVFFTHVFWLTGE